LKKFACLLQALERTMLKEIYLWVMSRSEGLLAKLTGGRRWLARGVVLAVLFSLFISFPRISFFLGNDSQIVNFWPAVESQAKNPLSATGEQFNDPALHSAKLAFRLTLPMIIRVLHIDWRGILVLQFCLGVGMLFLVGKIAMDLFADRITALASVFGVSAIYAGKAPFLQIGGVGDAFAYAFLTIAASFRSLPLVGAVIFAACFTDERAIVVAPLVGVYWAIRNGKDEGPNWFNAQTIVVVAAIGAACVVRLVLMFRYGLYIPMGSGKDVGLDVIQHTLPRLQYELPHVLAGLWLWPLAAYILLVRSHWWITLVLVTGVTAATVGVALVVLDVDRSLAYSLPILFVSMAIAASRRVKAEDIRNIAIVSLIICLMFPVNNLLGGVHNRYSVGNLMPVELIRFHKYSTHP
jgi:hypothetical protein